MMNTGEEFLKSLHSRQHIPRAGSQIRANAREFAAPAREHGYRQRRRAAGECKGRDAMATGPTIRDAAALAERALTTGQRLTRDDARRDGLIAA